MIRFQRLAPFFMLAITMLACVIPGIPSPDRGAASTAAAETSIAELTQNAPPTITATFEATATRTFTPTFIYLTPRFPSETPTLPVTPGTETPTLEPTATFTLLPVVIRVTRPTHCRSGPGTEFEIVGSFLVGMKATVLGRSGNSQFYYIPNPYVYTDYCWVSGKYAEFEGNPLLLPVVISPPTPTPTATLSPILEFKLKESGFNTCNSKWWMNIEITSGSVIPFESVKIEVLDRDTGEFRVVSYNNFPFSKNCGGLAVNDNVLNGTAVLVSSPKFEYNFKGHILRASVTVCGQDDLKGSCTTREIPLTP